MRTGISEILRLRSEWQRDYVPSSWDSSCVPMVASEQSSSATALRMTTQVGHSVWQKGWINGHILLITPIKRFHDSMAGLADVSALQDFHDGNPNYLDVCPERTVVHIPYIQPKLLCPWDGISSMTLSPARNTRANLLPTGLFWRIERQILHQQRPSPYQSHIAL